MGSAEIVVLLAASVSLLCLFLKREPEKGSLSSTWMVSGAKCFPVTTIKSKTQPSMQMNESIFFRSFNHVLQSAVNRAPCILKRSEFKFFCGLYSRKMPKCIIHPRESERVLTKTCLFWLQSEPRLHLFARTGFWLSSEIALNRYCQIGRIVVRDQAHTPVR